MEHFLDIFTTREIALGFWLIILALFLILWDKTRKDIIKLVKCLVSCKLIIFYLIPIAYSIIFAYFLAEYLSAIDLWRLEYAKVIFIWTLFTGFILCSDVVSGGLEKGYFKKLILDALKYTVFVEYLTGLFTFNLLVEIIILPIFSFFFLTYTFADTKEEYSDAKSLISIILVILLIAFFAYTAIIAVDNYPSLNAIDVVIGFLIPIIFLIINIPLIYLLAVFGEYEKIFCQMRVKKQIGKDIKAPHKKKVFLACGLSYKKLCRFQENYTKQMYSGMSENEFDELIDKFKANLIKFL